MKYVLHTHRERRLRARLVRYGGDLVSVLSVPWQLEPAEPEEGIAQETAGPAAKLAVAESWLPGTDRAIFTMLA